MQIISKETCQNKKKEEAKREYVKNRFRNIEEKRS